MINATTALGAMEILDDLGYRVSNDAMTEGLKEVDWPGRLEVVCSSPRVLLDGAHNPDGALSLKESLEKDFQYHHLVLLIGIMKDKDVHSILHSLSPLADHIIFTRPGTDRAASPALLRKALGRNGKKAEVIEDFRKAIDRGLSLTSEEDILCITGSLYTVGEARSYFLPRGGL
jgi:dihydrofolate synthase/folylpolyglutamate synthase